MVIVRSAGRLGNQLFVISALRELCTTNESLVLVGFEEIVETMPDALGKFHHVPLPRRLWSRWDFLEKVLEFLGAIRVIAVITPHPTERRLMKRPGIFPLSFSRAGWCQDEKLIDSSFCEALNERLADDSSKLLSSEFTPHQEIKNNQVFFIHMRRGDYLRWPTPDFPAVLPNSWYINAIDEIRRVEPNAQFLIFSDDLDYAKGFAKSLKGTVVVDADRRETLTYMSSCAGGILSASTFSWWGAKLASLESNGPFIAPMYWFTWGEKYWEESHFLQDTSFLTWMPVDSSVA